MLAEVNPSIKDLEIAYTEFPDRFALSKSDKHSSWGNLVERLSNPPRAASKGKCPWFKLARFGEVVTAKKCFRHSANIAAITGLEGDYDAGEVSVQQAGDRLAAMGVEAFLYTSASHTTDAPRWRVVVPLSHEYRPEDRKRFMALLNGCLGGILAAESFVDVQSYYYGRVDGAVFEARHVRGLCLDTIDELGCAPDPAPPRGRSLSNVVRDASIATQSDVDSFDLDRLFEISRVDERVVAELRSAFVSIDMSDRHDWIATAQYMRCLEEVGYDIWSEASKTAPNADADDELRYRFFGCDGSRTDFRAVFKLAAEKYGWKNPRKQDDAAHVEVFERDADGNRINSFQLALARAEAPIKPDLIKGVIPDAEFGIIYGKSGSGKSFAAIDLGYHLALGQSWRGCKVKQRPVFYIAAEGALGVRRRAKAYAEFHDIDVSAPFYTRERSVNMHAKNGWVAAAEDITELLGDAAGVIFIDTLSRSIPGVEENSAKDMSQVIENCQALGRATNCMVIVIAHAGKDDDKGVRGSSTLRAAADFELSVTRHLDTQWRCLKLTKSKDDVDGTEFAFTLTSVDVGMDEDGDPVFSAVAVPSDAPSPVVKKPQGARQRRAFDAFAELVDIEDGAEIEIEHVINRALEINPDDSKNARSNLRTTIREMCKGEHAYFYELRPGFISSIPQSSSNLI